MEEPTFNSRGEDGAADVDDDFNTRLNELSARYNLTDDEILGVTELVRRVSESAPVNDDGTPTLEQEDQPPHNDEDEEQDDKDQEEKDPEKGTEEEPKPKYPPMSKAAMLSPALRVLAWKKFEVERAVTALPAYLEFRAQRQIDNPRRDVIVQFLLAGVIMAPVESVDLLGRRVVFLHIKNLDSTTFSHEDILHSVAFILDGLLDDENVLRNGITFCVQTAGAGWANFDRVLQQEMAGMVSKSTPLRVQLMLMVDVGFVVRAFLAIVAVFLSKKMVERQRAVSSAELVDHLPFHSIPKRLEFDVTANERSDMMDFDLDAWVESLPFPPQSITPSSGAETGDSEPVSSLVVGVEGVTLASSPHSPPPPIPTERPSANAPPPPIPTERPTAPPRIPTEKPSAFSNWW